MKSEQMPPSAICALCKGPAVDEQHSQEHIIAAAMGGRRTVSGFICRTCNSSKGSTWDAALADDLEDLARILNISRSRGPVRPKTVYTSGGVPVHVLPGNRIERGHPTVEKSTDGDRTTVHIVAGSVEELREIAQTLIGRRKLNRDVDRVVEGASEHSEYLVLQPQIESEAAFVMAEAGSGLMAPPPSGPLQYRFRRGSWLPDQAVQQPAHLGNRQRYQGFIPF